MEKVCIKCRENKPIENFGKRAISADGFHCYCRACRSLQHKHYLARRGDLRNELKRERYASDVEFREKILVSERTRMKNPENYARKRAQVSAWVKKNPEKTAEYSSRYYQKDPDQRRAAARAAYWRNPEKERERMLAWQKANPGVNSKNRAMRRAMEIAATPTWLTDRQKDLMECFYIVSSILTDLTGERHHVDHIHPLNGDNVRGLHVPWNLRVITAKENISKSNRMVEVK